MRRTERLRHLANLDATESIDNLVSNVEQLLAQMGNDVDPDLARLRAAVYTDVSDVRPANPSTAPKRGAQLRRQHWRAVAIAALAGVAIGLGVILCRGSARRRPGGRLQVLQFLTGR